jgi:hypothetical protein
MTEMVIVYMIVGCICTILGIVVGFFMGQSSIVMEINPSDDDDEELDEDLAEVYVEEEIDPDSKAAEIRKKIEDIKTNKFFD